LEYGTQLWNPSNVGDVEVLESVQRKFTRGLRGARGLNYAQRCEFFKLCTLENRRKFLDPVFAYKLIVVRGDVTFFTTGQGRQTRKTHHNFPTSVGNKSTHPG
jgi:hypothetical protein